MTAVNVPRANAERDAVEGADVALAAAEDADDVVDAQQRRRRRRRGRRGCRGRWGAVGAGMRTLRCSWGGSVHGAQRAGGPVCEAQGTPPVRLTAPGHRRRLAPDGDRPHPHRRCSPPCVLAALALGGALLALAPGATRLPAGGRAVPVLVVVIGWAFAGVGVLAWHRRPDNRTGALLAAFGVHRPAQRLRRSPTPRSPTSSPTIADPLAIAVFLHLLLAFPSGRVEERRAAAGGRPRPTPSRSAPSSLIVLFDADLGDPDCARLPAQPPARDRRGRARRRPPRPCSAPAGSCWSCSASP